MTRSLCREEYEEKMRLMDDELSQLREENKRLKGLNTSSGRLFSLEDRVLELEAACALKDTALDRCRPAIVFGPGGYAVSCCQAITRTTKPNPKWEELEHKPDCWWQAARKAGNE